MTAIYIGAGLHLEPLNNPIFKDVIFIDSQPWSEFDRISYYSGFYRKNFIKQLDAKYQKLGYIKLDELILKPLYPRTVSCCRKVPYKNPTVLFYRNDQGNISRYFVSSGFSLGLSNALITELRKSDTLILSGYFPTTDITYYMRTPLNVYCYPGSYYGKCEYDKTIVDYFYDHPKIIKKLYLVDQDTVDYPDIKSLHEANE